MKLDHFSANPVGRINLPLIRCNKDRHAAADVPQRRNKMRQPVLVVGHLKTALSRALLAFLGNDTDSVRLMA